MEQRLVNGQQQPPVQSLNEPEIAERVRQLRVRGYDKVTKEYSSTGQFSKITGESPPKKTWWDWLQLLIIPIVLAAVSFGFGYWQYRISDASSQRQHDTDLQITNDQQQGLILQSYLDQMSDLLFNQHLDKSQPRDEVRNVARARTVTALTRLDSSRKGVLLRFLYEAQLIGFEDLNTHMKKAAIISLEDADLSGADLHGLNLPAINLHKAHLDKANLSGAGLWDGILDSTTLDNATLSGAKLNGVLLEEASLQSTDLQGAILADANLFGAKLNGANLSGADLSRAYLLFTQLTYRCFEKGNVQECNKEGVVKVKADLSGAKLQEAYLGGADLTGANLRQANVTGADLTGARGADLTGVQGQPRPAAEWEVFKHDYILLIAHHEGTALPQYGALDLGNSALRLGWYDSSKPLSGWGTSLNLLPALWSKSCDPKNVLPSYCEDAQGVTVSYKDTQRGDVQVTPDTPIGLVAGSNQDPLVLTIHGTIAGLPVTSTMTLSPPGNTSISAKVETKVEGSVELDTKNHPDAAFQPILLRSMHISSTRWDSLQAFADGQRFVLPFPGDSRITPSPVVVQQKFGLLGGTSLWKTDAPTVEVQKVQLEPAQTIQVTGWINKSTDPNNDNVRFWCASGQVLPSWSYTLIVSRP